MSDYEKDLWYEMLQKYWKEFPKLRILSFDDHWFFKRWFKNTNFAAITLWNTVYMRKDYLESIRGIQIMKHEIVHMRDAHKWHVLYLLSYWFLPVGPSFKALWEWRAYQIDLANIWHEYKNLPGGEQTINSWKQWVANQFIYQNYAWMLPWPWFVYRMIDKFMAKLP